MQPSWELVERPSGIIVGIDEVGRGAWAGPMTVAAVALPHGLVIDGVRDSKLLSHAQRVRLDRLIRRQAAGIGIGWVSCTEIDRIGLSESLRLASRRALSDLNLTPELIVLDGTWNYLQTSVPVQLLPKADLRIVPVAAASIIAKVARDRYVERLLWAERYGYARHRGYATAAHRQAVAEHGLGPHHRRSWAVGGAYVD